MTQYQPVDCRIHSNLELHIMHGDTLTIRWHNNDGTNQTESLLPVDIVSIKDSGEFLLLKDSRGNNLKIRLDKIESFDITE